jgi:hypothetical protein
MEVGDLVKVLTVTHRGIRCVGLVVAKVQAFENVRYFRVWVKGQIWPFQSHQLEVISESR